MARLARRPDHGPRGRRERRHHRRLRAQPVRPRAAVDPRPLAPDAAVDPEHVPAQDAAHPHARGADARRGGVHERVHAPREPRRDDQRDARLLQLQRPGGPRDAGPDADPRAHRGAGAGRRGRRAVDVRERPARPGGRLDRQNADRVRAARRRADRAPEARGGAVPRPGRRQRAGRHPQLPRRRARRAGRRHGHAADGGPRRRVHARRHRPVAHPAAVPVRAVVRDRHADPRRRQGRDPDGDHGVRRRRPSSATPRPPCATRSSGAGSRSPPRRRGRRSRRRSTACSTRCSCSCR